MITPELSNYVKDSRAAGMDDAAIKQALLSQGWQEADALEALAQPASAAALPTTAPEAAAQPNKFKKILFPAIGVAVLLAIGASATYFYYPMSPEKVLTKMMEKSGNIASGNYKASFEATLNSAALTSYIPEVLNTSKPDASNSGKVAGTTSYQSKIDFSGTFDSSDVNHPKAEVSITGTVAGYSASLDLKVLEKIIYLKLNQAPEIGMIDLQKILNTWIKFDIAETSKEMGMDIGSDTKELSAEQKKQMQELLAQARIFSISNKLADEKLGGVSTYHYSYKIDKDGLINLITKAGEIVLGNPMTDSEKQDLSRASADVSFKDGEIWIGKKDFYLYKITGGISATDTVSSAGSGELGWQLEFSNINKPVNIQAPTDFKTMQEIIALLMPAASSDTLMQAADAKRLADIRNIQTSLELYYNDNNAYPKSLESIVMYISTLPVAPTSPDGNCTAEQNSYKYSGGGKNYNLTFCLGGTTGGYSAGVHSVSPLGIK